MVTPVLWAPFEVGQGNHSLQVLNVEETVKG